MSPRFERMNLGIGSEHSYILQELRADSMLLWGIMRFFLHLYSKG